MAVTKTTPQLRFPEFTDEWQVKSLGDIDIYVADGNYGEMYPKASEMKDSGVPFIRANNLKNGKLTWRDMKYIDNDLHKVLQSGHLKTGDTLITTRGDIGITALVTSDFDDANINAQICLLRSGRELVSEYIFQTLQTRQSKSQIMSLQTGSALKQLPKGKLALVKLGIPSKPEQEKIADFLTAVDERIRLQEQKLAKLEQYKRGVMQQIFSQKIRFKDGSGNKYPEWQEKRLGEIGETYNGLTGKAGDDFGNGSPFITYMQIFSNSKISGKFGKVRISANEKQNTVKYGDIFFTTSSETPEETGFTSVLLDNLENTYLNSFCFGYRVSKNQLLPEFARYLFHSVGVRSAIVRLAQGSTRYNISKIALMNMAIFLPSHKEQQKIANFLTALDDKITAEKSKLTAAKQFKKALLQRMFV